MNTEKIYPNYFESKCYKLTKKDEEDKLYDIEKDCRESKQKILYKTSYDFHSVYMIHNKEVLNMFQLQCGNVMKRLNGLYPDYGIQIKIKSMQFSDWDELKGKFNHVLFKGQFDNKNQKIWLTPVLCYRSFPEFELEENPYKDVCHMTDDEDDDEDC